MLKEYYRTRGWDVNGVPTRQKLTDLGLLSLVN
jgi:aldehyde:ferredoxin oxidoreductase